MQERLLEFIKEIQSDERYDSFDEPEIKQGIGEILPHVESDRLIRILSKIRTYLAHKKKGVPLQ